MRQLVATILILALYGTVTLAGSANYIRRSAAASAVYLFDDFDSDTSASYTEKTGSTLSGSAFTVSGGEMQPGTGDGVYVYNTELATNNFYACVVRNTETSTDEQNFMLKGSTSSNGILHHGHMGWRQRSQHLGVQRFRFGLGLLEQLGQYDSWRLT